MIYWIFGFKYWVVAQEIPEIMEETKRVVGTKSEDDELELSNVEDKPKRFWTEKRYKIAMWLGIFLNVADCFWVGVERGLCNYHVGIPPYTVPHKLSETLHYAYYSQEFLLFLSALILADAIRRFYRLFQTNNTIRVNTKVMTLHITALFIHTFFLVFFQFCVIMQLQHPGNNTWIMTKDTSRNLMYTSQTISQMIVIYLFCLFAKPGQTQSQADSSDEETEDYTITRRASTSNADFLYYVNKSATGVNSNAKSMRFRTKSREALDAGLLDLGEGLDLSNDANHMETDNLAVDVVDEDDEFFKQEEKERDRLTNRMSIKYGEEEAQLRVAVFVSFVNKKDKLKFNKMNKIKKKKNKKPAFIPGLEGEGEDWQNSDIPVAEQDYSKLKEFASGGRVGIN